MKLLFLLALIYAGYAIVMVLLHPRFIYPFQPDGGLLKGFRQVELRGEDGAPIFVQEYPGDGPVLVYFMGNAGALPLFESAFPQHIAAGRHVIAMEYRGGGGRPGTPREAILKSDAMAVMDYAERLGKTLIVQGFSMGTGLATYVAARRNVAALVLVAPYDAMCRLMSVRAKLPACRLPFVDRWRSLDEARSTKVPTLILHGGADSLIPPSYSAAFETLPNVRRKIIERAGHADIGNFPEFDASLGDFLKEF